MSYAKQIRLKCCCGAEIEINDSSGSYAGNVGPDHCRDEQGRMWQAEVVADRWLDRHQTCLATRNSVAAMNVGNVLEGENK